MKKFTGIVRIVAAALVVLSIAALVTVNIIGSRKNTYDGRYIYASDEKTRIFDMKDNGDSVHFVYTISDDEGNVYTVWVEAKLYRARTPRSSDGSLSDGRYSEGDQIELTAKISNDALGVVDNIGDLLNTAMKTKLGKLAASAMSPYVGKTIEAGSTLASVLASAVSSFNIVTDKNGFEVIGTFEWTHFRHQIQGIDLWDWGFVGVRVEGY